MVALKVYLETTVFNRYFEDGREYSIETKMLFEKIQAGEIDGYTSLAVLEELEQAPSPKKEQMIALISSHDITVWDVEQNAYDLADLYIEMGIIPMRFRLDGVHIAMAVINDMDCIVSLNFHHINRLRTKTATEIIHRMKGYAALNICTPMELIYNDE